MKKEAGYNKSKIIGVDRGMPKDTEAEKLLKEFKKNAMQEIEKAKRGEGTSFKELKFYQGKKVNILDTKGRLYIGTVNDYFYPDDNDSGKESIILDTTRGDAIEFTEDDIDFIIAI